MILLDTCVLARLPDTSSPDRPRARSAVAKLLRGDLEMVIVPQNIYEFWAVATRKRGAVAVGGQNGLSMPLEMAALWIRRFQNLCRVLPEVPEILPLWQSLVISQKVGGFKAHDLRLVAAMQAHGIGKLLTFNAKHFKGMGIEVIDPGDL